MKAKRTRMGRPPKAAAVKQSVHVMVCITPAERRALAKDAKAAGLTMGGYLRALWLRMRKGR